MTRRTVDFGEKDLVTLQQLCIELGIKCDVVTDSLIEIHRKVVTETLKRLRGDQPQTSEAADSPPSSEVTSLKSSQGNTEGLKPSEGGKGHPEKDPQILEWFKQYQKDEKILRAYEMEQNKRQVRDQVLKDRIERNAYDQEQRHKVKELHQRTRAAQFDQKGMFAEEGDYS